MARYRVTVDTGGTFSDFVALNEETGKLSIAKLPSTPDDPSRAIVAGVEQLIATAGESTEIGYFCHGTTVGTNALLEGKGAKTGLLVTEGFRGIYPVGEQARPYGAAIFDVMYDKPAPLVPHSLTGEVKERIDFRGNVLQALDEAALRETVRQLAAEDVESIAVCLLFSFLHPAHEARVREIVREEIPDCDVSLSCEVLPQIREYYRLSSTVINAYLQPILARYIAELDRRLDRAGVATRQKYIMQSNGVSSRGQVAQRDLAVPMLDINTVSAGGGTIATVDGFGMLQVGPASAGAVPGPACYGCGGEMPTITDCNLVLGYLGEDGFLGGRMRLEASRARAAIMAKVARPLGLDLIEAAEGIVRIIDVKMQEAIKAISTMRGHDLRDFMLLAFGGAGPLHAPRIARELGMAGVIVPLYPGVFSAIGLLMSDVKHDYIRSKLAPLTEVAPEEMNHIFEQLSAQAFTELRGDGFAPDRIRIERALDMRYAGQGYEIAVPCPAEPLRPSNLKELRVSFDQRHQRMFGHMAPEEPVEIVSYRVRGLGLLPPVEMPKFARTGAALEDARRGMRRVRFDGAERDCPIYQRDQLDVGANFAGPAILEQLDCTTVVRPGHIARVDEWKNLIVTQEN